METEVRVRFAPSPTGFLHIGGARTALFNWLFARASGGKFLLRLEDTDRERSKPEFVDDILESLRWLGLDWDEEPISQSSRLDRHKEYVEQLLESGKAYRCDCSPETLNAIRQQCQKDKLPFRYPGTCREKTSVAEKHVVRLKTPEEGETTFTDLIRGDITVPNKDVDDWVISRSSGYPTYNFVVVIDDHDQKVTHVLRGEDHINNTPKQVQLCEALGLPIPKYAHLPMILGKDKAKLSKRHGAASTLEYRKMGYLPAAMINFLVRLGWSHGDQEIFSIEELKSVFSLKAIGKANAIFNSDKLTWWSGHYFREIASGDLLKYLQAHFSDELAFVKDVEESRLLRGIEIIQGKIKIIPELIEQLHCLFGEDPQYDPTQLKDSEGVRQLLETFVPVVEAASFEQEALETAIRGKAQEADIKFGKVAQAIRFGLTGGKVSPGLFEMLSVLGKEVATRRLKAGLASIGEQG